MRKNLGLWQVYLASMILVISKNWKNPTFYPTIDQLRLYREKIEKATE